MARAGLALLLLSALWVVAACGGGRGAPARSGMLVPEEAVGLHRGTFGLLDVRIREEELRRRIPGGVLAVSAGGRLVYSRAFGTGAPHQMYDIASLTKPLLAPAAWELASSGDAPLSALGRDVLAHRSGWDDEEHYEPLLRAMIAAPGGDWEAVLNGFAPPVDLPGAVYLYSNTAHALLSMALAREVPGARARFANWLEGVPGAGGIAFAPVSAGEVAPSGRGADGNVLRGRPFDPLADVMVRRHGLLPLHSGAFARADSLARVSGWMLASDEARAREARALLFGDVEARQDAATGRTVHVSAGGLRSPTGPPWAAEGSAPGRCFVQTGYTGCLLWVDVESQVVAVLLTNASAGEEHDAWEELARELVRVLRSGIAQPLAQ